MNRYRTLLVGQTTPPTPTVILNGITDLGSDNYEFYYTLSEGSITTTLTYKESISESYMIIGMGETISGDSITVFNIPALSGIYDFKVFCNFTTIGLVESNTVTLGLG